MKLNEVIKDPKSSFSEIGAVISKDTSLSARLLKIVNSGFYSFPSKVETIVHAISIVGLQQLRDLAFATTIIFTFKDISEELVSMNSFWKHNIAVGIAARNIAIYRREVNVERFYLIGILHDIGRLILFENMPKLARDAIDQTNSSNDLLFKKEREVIGFDHAAVGGVLLHEWKFPDSLEEVVTYHHDPSYAKRYPVETAIVHFADVMVHAMELGKSGENCVPPLDPKAWDLMGIPVSAIGLIMGQVEKQYTTVLDNVFG